MEYEKLLDVKYVKIQKIKSNTYKSILKIYLSFKVVRVISNVIHTPFKMMRPSFHMQFLSTEVKGLNIKEKTVSQCHQIQLQVFCLEINTRCL